MNDNKIEVQASDAIYDKQLSAGEVEARLTRLLNSPGGLQKVAQQMLSPLKRDLLYEGRIRQLFQTYKLALGEEAVFDADVDVPAASLSIEGLPQQQEVRADRIRIETSPIASRPEVRWNESNFRKFDILNRVQERAKASIQQQEDIRGFNLIDFAAGLTNQTASAALAGTTAASNNPSTASATGNSGHNLAQVDLVNGIVQLRSRLVVASKIWINPIRNQDLMLFNTVAGGAGGSGIFAPNFQEQALKAGRVGSIWGVEVLESVVVPAANTYVLAPADYLGVMAVRTDISVETMKNVMQMADVFAIWEDVGFLIRFAKGIHKITVS